ncbi:MAG: hypothetical protein KGI54_07400 [Pseudomonadota bacterium]|nr:hypothetical protein [Pseudomonadota bacterium]
MTNSEITLIELMIAKFRSSLDDHCQTARSIDRNDSWMRIAKIAHMEGYLEFEQALEGTKKSIRAFHCSEPNDSKVTNNQRVI